MAYIMLSKFYKYSFITVGADLIRNYHEPVPCSKGNNSVPTMGEAHRRGFPVGTYHRTIIPVRQIQEGVNLGDCFNNCTYV